MPYSKDNALAQKLAHFGVHIFISLLETYSTHFNYFAIIELALETESEHNVAWLIGLLMVS